MCEGVGDLMNVMVLCLDWGGGCDVIGTRLSVGGPKHWISPGFKD
jgi:hypothetical protein